MMSLWDALRMNMMISYQELVRTFPKFTESYGPAIIHFCYWISINSDCRYLFNGGINAVNCAFLRTFIQ